MYATVACETERGARKIRALERPEGLLQQTRPMARGYRVTDPHRFAEQLRHGGFYVEVTQPRIIKLAKSGNGWRHMVLATEPRGDAGYVRGAQFLCAHDGRTAFVAAPLSLRLYCANVFHLAPVRIHHTDPDLDEILRDPVPFARQLARDGALVAERVETLRGVGHCRPFFAALEPFRRLATKADRAWAEEPRYDTWAALQAYTRTQSPTLVRLASLALTEGWEQTRQGQVPECWAPVLEQMAEIRRKSAVRRKGIVAGRSDPAAATS